MRMASEREIVMKSKDILFTVAAAVICGGIAGDASVRVGNGGAKPEAERTIVEVEKLHFVDDGGELRAVLELDARRGIRLILKDPAGKFLYDLPPSPRVLPACKQ